MNLCRHTAPAATGASMQAPNGNGAGQRQRAMACVIILALLLSIMLEPLARASSGTQRSETQQAGDRTSLPGWLLHASDVPIPVTEARKVGLEARLAASAGAPSGVLAQNISSYYRGVWHAAAPAAPLMPTRFSNVRWVSASSARLHVGVFLKHASAAWCLASPRAERRAPASSTAALGWFTWLLRPARLGSMGSFGSSLQRG